MRPEDVKRVFQNNAEDLVEWITKGGRSSLLVKQRKAKKTKKQNSFNEFFSWIPSSIKILCLYFVSSISCCSLLFFIITKKRKKKK